MIEVEQRARMARIEDGGEVRADLQAQGLHEYSAKRVVDAHAALHLSSIRHAPHLVLC